MKGPLVLVFLISYCVNIFCTKTKTEKGALHDSDFCYINPTCGPKKWNGLCNSGTRQSPINLDGEKMGIKILPPTYRQFYTFSTIAETKHFTIQNTGHTVQIQFPDGKEPILKGSTIGLPGTYRFFKMSFRWGRYDKDGSEHKISGKGYAMELHLVHYSTHYSTYNQASVSETDPNAIAIISILYEVGPLDNLALKPITEAIPLIRKFKNGEDITVNRFLNLKALFPTFLSFYRYEGSLTTPKCIENRVWSVFKKPNKISKKQLEEFRSIFIKDNVHLMVDNHRTLQKRNDRAMTLYFTPTNIYDWFIQLAIYFYTFIRQLMSLPGKFVQEQFKVILKPFISQVNLQNGLLGFNDIG